jgi:hypothetical protein
MARISSVFNHRMILLPPFSFIRRELTWHSVLNHTSTTHFFYIMLVMVMNLYLLESTFDYKSNHVKCTWQNKKLMGNLLVKEGKVWISFYVCCGESRSFRTRTMRGDKSSRTKTKTQDGKQPKALYSTIDFSKVDPLYMCRSVSFYREAGGLFTFRTTRNPLIYDELLMTISDFVIDHTTSMTNRLFSS